MILLGGLLFFQSPQSIPAPSRRAAGAHLAGPKGARDLQGRSQLLRPGRQPWIVMRTTWWEPDGCSRADIILRQADTDLAARTMRTKSDRS